jgi:broad specificity phosphatase PhoE
MLIVVRHARPMTDETVQPDQWRLSPDGLASAKALSSILPSNALLVASTEPMAIQTLEPGGDVHSDTRFVPVRRELFGGNASELRLAYLGGADLPGWEPHAEVVARFDAGIAEWQQRAGARPLVIASHALAMTTWLTGRVGLPDPVAFWKDLRMPDALEVGATVRRL